MKRYVYAQVRSFFLLHTGEPKGKKGKKVTCVCLPRGPISYSRPTGCSGAPINSLNPKAIRPAWISFSHIPNFEDRATFFTQLNIAIAGNS